RVPKLRPARRRDHHLDHAFGQDCAPGHPGGERGFAYPVARPDRDPALTALYGRQFLGLPLIRLNLEHLTDEAGPVVLVALDEFGERVAQIHTTSMELGSCSPTRSRQLGLAHLLLSI